MFIIKSIKLVNFRAVKEANLKPLANGITGIFGSNGAGKTTFLIGALYALFGEVPETTTVAALRREGSDVNEDCYVSIVVEHLNQTVEVYREIRGKNNTVKVFIYVDGDEVVHTSVGTANIWIRRRFGITAEGFKTAFVVKQKELDSLVDAKPSPRKELIEKLAGIQDMETALKDARKDENNYKKQLDILPGSYEDYHNSKDAYEDISNNQEVIVEEFNSARLSLKQSEGNFDKINTAYMNAREKSSYVESLASRIKNKKNDLTDLEQRLEQATQRLSGITVDDINRITSELKTMDDDLSEKREKFSSIRVNNSVAWENVDRLEKQLATIDELVKPQPVKVSSDELEKELQQYENEMNENRVLITRLNVEDETYDKSLVIFEQHECPTCHRAWDDGESEKEKIEHLKKDVLIKISDLNKRISELSTKIVELKKNIKDVKLVEVSILEYDRIISSRDDLVKQIKTNRDSIVATKDLDALKEEGIALASLRDLKQTELSEAKTALQFQKDVDDLVNKINIINIELPKLDKDLEQQRKTIPDLSSVEQETREARKSLEEERERFEIINNKFNQFNLNYHTLKTNYENQEERWEKKKDIQNKYQMLAAQTDILERFRKDSVARLAPELSNYATTFISEMTSGAFTEIILSDDFSPSIMSASGQERKASLLSGGEKSAVALALRLAISFLITKENPQFLWLDEVLTAQDSERRGSMLDTIRKLPISQVLMINHTQEASDVVDHVITLIPDVINGSTIKED